MDMSSEHLEDARKDKLTNALHALGRMHTVLKLPSDPDAQATVTDFLDFTEYLPSDVIRSLTLVGELDRTYIEASCSVHELTKTYGMLPSLPVLERPKPTQLRSSISKSMDEGLKARMLTYAEECRTAENVERHYKRAQNILYKLRAMAANYSPSRATTPLPRISASPKAKRPPKITLRLDGSRAAAAEQGGPRVRRQRAPRITVPGEVLAPYELDYESYGSESESWDSAEDEALIPRQAPVRSTGPGRIKLIKIPKPPRPPRPPGVMGTNVHSAVAGISTSNALAKLKPPPPDAILGSVDAPWLQLTDWELAKLRKRMKKNAVWGPSSTMIARELKMLGRGIQAYRTAKNRADAAGEPFGQTILTLAGPSISNKTTTDGAVSFGGPAADDIQLSNRGMKLNEAKKLKKENQAKELSKVAAEEAEESARKMAEAARAMQGLFVKPKHSKVTVGKSRAKPFKKRKRRESSGATEMDRVDVDETRDAIRPPKRSKTETPVPVPSSLQHNSQSGFMNGLSAQASDASSLSTTSTVLPPTSPTPGLLTSTTTTVPTALHSPKKSSTPILPPARESRRDLSREAKRHAAAAVAAPNTRRRTSGTATIATSTTTPALEALPSRRPPSRGTKAVSLEPAVAVATAANVNGGGAASAAAGGGVGRERSRRASTVHTARNTPAPPDPLAAAGTPFRQRMRRPAPGPVTKEAGGSAAVSVGKRRAAPRKKKATKQQQQQQQQRANEEAEEGRGGAMPLDTWVDEDGNVIDPDEPRYCLCNDVSWGDMIGCDNNDCEKEWFHLGCVGLSVSPPRTTKWYCPECRITLRIGERGEVSARGKRT